MKLFLLSLVESLCASKPGCVVHGGTAWRGRGICLYLFPSFPAKLNLIKVSEPCPGGKDETSSFGAEAMRLEAAETDIVYALDYGKLRERSFLWASKGKNDAC